VVLAYKPFGAPLTACRQTAADVQIGGSVRATDFEAWLPRVTSKPRLGGGAGPRAA
jgi:hypothetical protein